MRITVKAKPNARAESVVKKDGMFHVAVKAPATEGKANIAVARALANYFDIAPSRIRLISGARRKVKVFELSTAPL
ncbi:MAG: DUF167 domain-containing protein [Patescibacteria group bacterium]